MTRPFYLVRVMKILSGYRCVLGNNLNMARTEAEWSGCYFKVRPVENLQRGFLTYQHRISYSGTNIS
jgi:hypothetical protein